MVDEFQPEFAVLDIGLPVMSGYELGRALRESLGHRLTLYALSGYAQDKDRQLSRDAGFDMHFVKPMNVRVLLEHIAGGG